ncbi:MAG: poly(A) polymerase, partial [Planctomycetota bacterium]
HAKSVTLWLVPETEPPEALIHLQSILQKLFPQWQQSNPAPEKRFSPHLTLAKFSLNSTSEEEILAWMKQWQEEWKVLQFTVSEIALIHRQNQDPFEIKEEVCLGEKLVLPFIHKAPPDENVLTLLHQVTHEVLGESVVSGVIGLYPIGSTRLGIEDSRSDIDMVFIGPEKLSREQFFGGVLDTLQKKGYSVPARQVFEARNPILELTLHGKEIDLQYAGLSVSSLATPLASWSQKMLKALESNSLSAVLGILDAEKLLEHIHLYGGLTRFQEALRGLKLWTRYRGIHSQSFGFPGGFSWTLLLARSLKEVSPQASSIEVLRHFFHFLEKAAFQEPISLDPQSVSFEAKDRKDRLMVVLAPSAPWRNTTRSLIPSTLQVVKEEIRLVAQEWKSDSDFKTYCSSVRNFPSFPFYIEIYLTSPTLDSREKEVGKIQGRFLQFLLGIENLIREPNASVIRIRSYPYRILEAQKDGSFFSCRWRIGIRPKETEYIPLLESEIKALGEDFRQDSLGERTTSKLSVQLCTEASFFFNHWKNNS